MSARGYMGGGTVGGGDPDDADREEDSPVLAWIARAKETGMLDFEELKKAIGDEIVWICANPTTTRYAIISGDPACLSGREDTSLFGAAENGPGHVIE